MVPFFTIFDKAIIFKYYYVCFIHDNSRLAFYANALKYSTWFKYDGDKGCIVSAFEPHI